MSAEQVAKLIVFCAITVGLGLMILGGAALLLQPDLAREITDLDRAASLGLGATCLALAIGYLGLATFVRRPLRLRRWSLQMPSLPLAIGPFIIGPLNFACVAACLYQPLAAVADVAYPAVAAAYVIANVTALLTHVPGGLGVIEALLLLLLPQGQIVGALVVFRFVYFLVPLGIGSLLLANVELARRREARARGHDDDRQED